MRKRTLACLTLLALFAAEVSALADLVTASRATVRISHQEGISKGIGSGIIVGSDAANYYALTNAHVAPVAATMVEFFRDGKVAAICKGKTIARDTAADVAVVQISKEQLGKYIPSIIPIDPAYTLTAGDTLGTIGHPHGEGPTAYVCHYIRTNELGIHFQPPPKQGRSGSALFDRDFSRVIGLVYAVTTDGSDIGLAVPAAAFSKAIGRTLAAQTPRTPFRISPRRAIQTIQLYDTSDGDGTPTKTAPTIQKTAAVVNVLETSETGNPQAAAGPEIAETQCPGGRCPAGGLKLPKLELPKIGEAEGETLLPDTPLPIQQAPQVQAQTEEPQAQTQTEQTAIRQQLLELGRRLKALESATGVTHDTAQTPEQQTEQQASDWYPGKRIVEGATGDVQKKAEETVGNMLDAAFRLIVIWVVIFLALFVGAVIFVVALLTRKLEKK